MTVEAMTESVPTITVHSGAITFLCDRSPEQEQADGLEWFVVSGMGPWLRPSGAYESRAEEVLARSRWEALVLAYERHGVSVSAKHFRTVGVGVYAFR